MSFLIPPYYDVSRLVAFDPGLSTTGVAVYDVNSRTGQILRIYAYTIYTDQVKHWTDLDVETATERQYRLVKLGWAVRSAIELYNPIVVCCEAPFYHPKMPMAFVSLSEVIGMIRNSVLSYNHNIPFHVVEPQLVKKGVGVSGKKGKEVVCAALSNYPEIIQNLQVSLSDLDEHAVDAIAVGYATLKFKIPFV